MRRPAGLVAAAAALGLSLGCASSPRGWDPARLAAFDLPAGQAEALAWAVPFPAPREGRVDLVLCRWPDAATIPVGLEPGLAAAEREAIARVLSTVGDALGLALPVVPLDGASLEIRFPRRLAGARRRLLGDTVADCALGGAGPRLVRASIHLARAWRDPGRGPRALDADERAGLLLHELAHALGLSGHSPRGLGSVLASDRRALAAQGAALRRGEPLALPALRALYRVPSGTPVGSLALAPGAWSAYEDAVARAAREGFAGPRARAGDRTARVGWHGSGSERWLVVDDWPERVAAGGSLAWRAPRSDAPP